MTILLIITILAFLIIAIGYAKKDEDIQGGGWILLILTVIIGWFLIGGFGVDHTNNVEVNAKVWKTDDCVIIKDPASGYKAEFNDIATYNKLTNGVTAKAYIVTQYNMFGGVIHTEMKLTN